MGRVGQRGKVLRSMQQRPLATYCHGQLGASLAGIEVSAPPNRSSRRAAHMGMRLIAASDFPEAPASAGSLQTLGYRSLKRSGVSP